MLEFHFRTISAKLRPYIGVLPVSHMARLLRLHCAATSRVKIQ
jgi:hypothetical protein